MCSSITFARYHQWGGVKIGNDCIFGENVKIYDNDHTFNMPSKIKESGYHISDIKIGNDCWIANNVVILRGTTIGSHCVIGAGCIVKGEIPDNSIVKLKSDQIQDVIGIVIDGKNNCNKGSK